jgi:acyl carrier protein
MNTQLLEIINQVRSNKGHTPLPSITPETRLREDCNLDSLDLAELTVRIEEALGVDVFADGIVRTIGEILQKLHRER